MRFAGSVTLRPVRVGFLLPPDDFALARRVLLGLVGAECDPLPGRPMIVDEREGCLALGCAGRLRHVAGNCEAVAVSIRTWPM